MKRYDYRKVMREDVLQHIRENINFKDFKDLSELTEHLYESCMNDDCVTGNASGSYTMNALESEKNLYGNLELLGEAMCAFGDEAMCLMEGADWCDVTIRCYLLYEIVDVIVQDLEDEFDAAH